MRVLFVGRLAANKGVGDLLAAIEMLERSGCGDQIHLDIAGVGPLYDQLRLGREMPRVKFWGKVTDAELEHLYARADLFVLPTLFEGMPTVVLEAMARSLPVLVTDVGATRELVDETNGSIINKADPADLARHLEQMLNDDPNRLIELGDAGRRRVQQRFTWPQVAVQHHALFERLDQALAESR